MPSHLATMEYSAAKRKKPARNTMMLHKLRNGLEEYVRLYNPITTKWRELKLRANRGQNRIHLVGMDSEQDTQDTDDEYGSDFEYELGRQSLMESALGFDRHDNEHDDILAPLFERRLLQKLGGYETYDATLATIGGYDGAGLGSWSAREPLKPLQNTQNFRNYQRRNSSTMSIVAEDSFSNERKQKMKNTLNQMGMLKRNIARRNRHDSTHSEDETQSSSGNVTDDVTKTSDATQKRQNQAPPLSNSLQQRIKKKEMKKRMSERKLSLSVIKESPTKMRADSRMSHTSPIKQTIREDELTGEQQKNENEAAATQKQDSIVKTRVEDRKFQRRGSKGSMEDQYAAFNTGGKRGRARRKKKAQRFKRLARFLLVLDRLWKTHSGRVAELLESFDALDALVGTEKKESPKKPDGKQQQSKSFSDDLTFDVSLFKTTDEARIPREAKRILQAKPGTRSSDELHYLKTALRNYQTIVEYPMHMQVLLAERAWYEEFGPKRVIVREGHSPFNFYFILSGTVIISKYDAEKNINKTVTFLGKGDAFGDLAILNNTKRETTVITKAKTEFLVITRQDFKDIFTSGGLGNPKDPFLNSLWYLKGWPLEILIKHPKKALFNFFKRDVVLSKDTKQSDWIYIVKSGSLSVYKQLKFEQPEALKPTLLKPKVVKKQDKEHKEKLDTIFENQMQDMNDSKGISRQLMQPMAQELGIPINDVRDAYGAYGYIQARKESTGNPFTMASLRKNLHQETGNENKSDDVSGSQLPSGTMSRERSFAAVEVKSNKKVSFAVSGAILTKSNMKPNPPGDDNGGESSSQHSILSKSKKKHKVSGTDDEEEEYEDSEDDTTTEDGKESTVSSRHPQEQFITVQTLIKSGVFGLADVVYGAENMPSFSLVSNGAEVIMIDKKLYEDHTNQRLMTDLREQIYPYPNDAALQEMLRLDINWTFNCRSTLLNTLYEVGMKKSNVHNARSQLELKKPNPLEIET